LVKFSSFCISFPHLATIGQTTAELWPIYDVLRGNQECDNNTERRKGRNKIALERQQQFLHYWLGEDLLNKSVKANSADCYMQYLFYLISSYTRNK